MKSYIFKIEHYSINSKRRKQIHNTYSLSTLDDRLVVVLDLPPQSGHLGVALLHDELVLGGGHTQTLPADDVLQLLGISLIFPPLVTPAVQ